jgi:hypothetical protein
MAVFSEDLFLAPSLLKNIEISPALAPVTCEAGMEQRVHVSDVGVVRNFVGYHEENAQLPTQALGTILTPFDLLRSLRTGPRFSGGIPGESLRPWPGALAQDFAPRA